MFKKHTDSPLFILLLAAVLSACASVPASPSGNVTPGHTPGASDRPEITIERDINYGPGPFELPDTKVGLSDLSGYTATLTIAFDGTRDGNAEKWSKTYTMLATKDPLARQWTIEKSGNESVFIAEMGGLDYERRGEEACAATAIQEGNPLIERLEPASFLSVVIGAEEAGSDTVNDVATNHYTFDQRALGEDGLTESTGELWAASEGGYIVKYLLTRKGSAEYFGEGIEGTLTLDYELANPNQPVTIKLPDDCPPGFVEAPLLPDASNTSKIPGVLSYDTSSSIAAVADFYEKNIPGLGWQAQGEPAITDAIAILTYKQDDKLMMIVIKPGDAGTKVSITISKLQENPPQ
ncbi:MAG: hypothetical protein EHM40_20245 [Chloroflexi bacterium]|nr:MAG: hypothetical protein EHM40_20245 [Chloroflexota bacterium]